MDLQQTLRALYFERARIDQIISALEDLEHHDNGIPAQHPAKRRGRQFMSPEERKRSFGTHEAVLVDATRGGNAWGTLRVQERATVPAPK